MTVKGEVLVFETVGSLVKSDYYECKLVHKFKTKHSQDLNGNVSAVDFRLMKSGLVIHHSDGTFELYNLTNEAISLQLQSPEIYHSKMPVNKGKQSQKLLDMTDFSRVTDYRVMALGSQYVVARVPGTRAHLVMVEIAQPYLRQDAFFDVGTLNNFKIPMFLIAFAIVVTYQVYQKKQSEKNEIANAKQTGSIAQMAQLLAQKSGQKLNSQTKIELGEIEQMEQKLKGLTSQVEGLSQARRR